MAHRSARLRDCPRNRSAEMTDPTGYEAPSVEEIDNDGGPVSTAPLNQISNTN